MPFLSPLTMSLPLGMREYCQLVERGDWSKVRTMDSIVTKKVVWPHKVVCDTQGQPLVYGDMSLGLFANGYLTVLAEEAEDIKPFLLQHLQELMEDAKIYIWRAVRDYPAAWLQNIEQGHTDKKAKLTRTLVWNKPVPTATSPMTFSWFIPSHHSDIWGQRQGWIFQPALQT